MYPSVSLFAFLYPSSCLCTCPSESLSVSVAVDSMRYIRCGTNMRQFRPFKQPAKSLVRLLVQADSRLMCLSSSPFLPPSLSSPFPFLSFISFLSFFAPSFRLFSLSLSFHLLSLFISIHFPFFPFSLSLPFTLPSLTLSLSFPLISIFLSLNFLFSQFSLFLPFNPTLSYL